jgi:acetyl esterase/lipase
MNNIAGVLLVSFLLGCFTSVAQQEVPLYKNEIPGAKELAIDKSNDDKSVFFRVSTPTLRLYLGAKDSLPKTAVILCAGGGYAALNIKREGYNIAEAFNKKGVAAFVLKYRLPDDKTNTNKTIAPLQDAQQAIKMVRDSATTWGIDPNRIGIMGFSAGGHLAGSAGVHYSDCLIPNLSKTSLRPDFMLLIYPVISFEPAYGHIGSRDNLIGKKPAVDSINYFSLEKHVNSKTSPTFLTHPGDDGLVSVMNSVLFYQALQKCGVPADLHIYAKGGHGYDTTPTFDEWFGRCLNWMRTERLLK